MAATININGLLSTSISNSIGRRSMSVSNSFFDELVDDQGSILDKLWNFGKKVIGFLWKGAISLVKGIALSARTIVGWIVAAKEVLWQFNWQATDDQLKASIAANNVQIAALWGGVVGRGIGWMAAAAIGAGVSVALPVIGSTALAATVATTVGAEAMEDLTGELAAAIRGTAGRLAVSGILKGYMQIRRAIRGIALNIDWSQFGNQGGAIGSAIAQWGQRPNVTWTFQEATEDAVERIDSLPLQAFVEEVLEESWDAFVEGGYVVADVIDSQFDALRTQRGQERRLVLYPDSENQNERVVLYGNADDIRSQAMTTLNTHQLIRNRDVGYFDIPDTDTPLTQPSRRELKLICYTVEQPPLSRGKRHTIKIANPKLGITFADIKRVCRGLTTGAHYASARLIGHRGKMVVHGTSEDDAVSNLEKLAELCDGQLGNITKGVAVRTANKPAIQSSPIYPIYAQVGIKKPSATGNIYADGDRYERTGDRITLWYDNSPIGSGSIYTWLSTRE